MGGHMSKKVPESSSAINVNTSTGMQFRTELRSYEAACEIDPDLQTFDTTLQARTNQVINTLAVGVEVRSLSFDSLKQVTECLLEMNQEVVKTLDFCTALERCLKRARDSQLLILVAIQQFEEETESPGNNHYESTLRELKNFKAAGDPFTEEFFQIFRSVYLHQMQMLEKLQLRKNKLDKKLKYIHSWRKVTSMIFVATFAAVLICSVVAAAIAAPPVAAALAAASSIPIGSMGKWIDSLWKNYEDVLKGQKEMVGSMQAGTYVAIKDLDNIRVLIDRLEIEIESLTQSAEFAIEVEAVKVAIEEIKKKLGVFMKSVEDLGVQADICSRDIRKARTVVLQRIIKHPHN
ncbi:UPF0496 protein [Senna tora]|uniref:UPF0496 protein n=1 Tax=Senna tora TaxID=362788 RepID=A0A834SUW6_9FABA|nr:UPF0496 protein [Senna tora]